MSEPKPKASAKETIKQVLKDIENYDFSAVEKRLFKPPSFFWFSKKKVGSNGLAYASYSNRVFAMLLDMLLVLFLCAPPLGWVTQTLFPQAFTAQAQNDSMGILFAWDAGKITLAQAIEKANEFGILQRILFDYSMNFIIFGAFSIGFLYRYAATPAMMLMRMYVADAKTGGKITLLQCVVRYFGVIVAMLPLTLGFIWIMIDKRGQGWHDKLAGTVVIQKPFKWWGKKEGE
jgi:uncharacterized RDD family membrane protein YckC